MKRSNNRSTSNRKASKPAAPATRTLKVVDPQLRCEDDPIAIFDETGDTVAEIHTTHEDARVFAAALKMREALTALAPLVEYSNRRLLNWARKPTDQEPKHWFGNDIPLHPRDLMLVAEALALANGEHFCPRCISGHR